MIDPAQRRVHVASELIAVLLVVPFGLYLAADSRQRSWVRLAGGALAVGTLIVDGSLLLRWAQTPKHPALP